MTEHPNHPKIVHDVDSDVYQLLVDDVLMLSGRLPHEIMQRVHTGKLSRFASVRYQDNIIRLTSPIGYDLTIHDLHILPIIFSDGDALATPSLTAALWSFLHTAGLTDIEDSRYDAWTYPDVMTAYSENESPPLRLRVPPIQPPMSKTILSLETGGADRPFHQLLRQRRTLYDYSGNAITLEQLGEFLYVAKVQEFIEGVLYDTTIRLYPSAGAAYELEIYVLSHDCSGLTRGLYHYDPSAHSLEQLMMPINEYDQLIQQIITNTGYQLSQPQVALFITARMRRINWKNHALALAHQDTGILIQTFYLAATALNLAPCALGGFDAATMQVAAGINAIDEPLMAGFLLGNS